MYEEIKKKKSRTGPHTITSPVLGVVGRAVRFATTTLQPFYIGRMLRYGRPYIGALNAHPTAQFMNTSGNEPQV